MGTSSQIAVLTSSTEFNALCRRGCAAFREKRYRNAMLLFEQAVAAQPKNGWGRKLLGTACAFTGDFDTATIHFRRMVELTPRDPAGHINLGAALNMTKDYAEAVRVLRHGLRMTIDQPEFYYNLGIAHRNLEQPMPAISCYRECLRMDPSLASACVNLANIYCRQEDWSRALEYYSQALQVRPGYRRAQQGYDHVNAVMAGLSSPGIPKSSPGLVVHGAVANEDFTGTGPDEREEYARALARSVTLAEDLVTYLKLRIQPTLLEIARSRSDTESQISLFNVATSQFRDNVRFLEMMYGHFQSEQQRLRESRFPSE